jgi:hypothetical protein
LENLFQYIVAFLPKWWAIFSVGALFGIDEAVKHWGSPWLNEKLNVIQEAHRRTIKITALLIAIFYAGFSAWSDERAKTFALEEGGQISPFRWSRLSDLESAELRRYLRDIPPQKMSIMCTGSFCDDLAQSLRKALSPLHWHLDCCSSSLIGGGDFAPGIHIWNSEDHSNNVGDAIEKATNGKIQFDRADKPATDPKEYLVQIMIGPKT